MNTATTGRRRIHMTIMDMGMVMDISMVSVVLYFIVFGVVWCGVMIGSVFKACRNVQWVFFCAVSVFIQQFHSYFSFIDSNFWILCPCCLLLATCYWLRTRLYWRTPSPLPSDEHCDHSDHEKESHDHSRWVTFKATITRHEFVRA